MKRAHSARTLAVLTVVTVSFGASAGCGGDERGAIATDASTDPQTSHDAGPDLLDDTRDVAGAVGYSAVWSEFLTLDEVRANLPLLATADVALNLAWPVSSLGDPAYLEVARAATDAGVEVRPWLLLEESDGYWPGSTNADLFVAAGRELMARWAAAGLAPTWLVVDMELHIDRAFELRERFGGELDLEGLVSFFRAGIDEAQYAEATGLYARFVDEAHAAGWRVHVTTLPFVLDDFADGDDDVRQALGIPLEGIAWDLMTFQIYRTLLNDIFAGLLAGDEFTAYVVYDFGLLARDRFGDRAGVDIGMVQGGVSQGAAYRDASELLEDVEAATAAGIPRSHIIVYNFDGMVARSDQDWLVTPRPEPSPPVEDTATPMAHSTIQLLDALE